jgi:hypothetical protein
MVLICHRHKLLDPIYSVRRSKENCCRSVYGTPRFVLYDKSVCSDSFSFSVELSVNLHGYHDFVAEGPLQVERLLRCLLVSRRHKLIDVLSGLELMVW